MLAASPIQAPTLFQRPRRWARQASVTGSASNSDICPSHSVLESAALLSDERDAATTAGTGDQRRRSVRTTIAAQMPPTTRLQAIQSSSAGHRVEMREGQDQQVKLRRIEVDRLGQSRRTEHREVGAVHREAVEPAIHGDVKEREVRPDDLTPEAARGQSARSPRRRRPRRSG